MHHIAQSYDVIDTLLYPNQPCLIFEISFIYPNSVKLLLYSIQNVEISTNVDPGCVLFATPPASLQKGRCQMKNYFDVIMVKWQINIVAKSGQSQILSQFQKSPSNFCTENYCMSMSQWKIRGEARAQHSLTSNSSGNCWRIHWTKLNHLTRMIFRRIRIFSKKSLNEYTPRLWP